MDRYDRTVYRNMIVAGLEGVTSYNRYINHTPPYKWIIPPELVHDGWFCTSSGHTAAGRPAASPSIRSKTTSSITRLQGALIYVTVGDAPIEQYL